MSQVSVNKNVQTLVNELTRRADELRIGVAKGAAGETLIDCGANVAGSLEAGRLMTEICLGGLGRVNLASEPTFKNWPWCVNVHSWSPVVACLGSQYAGWQLTHGEGENAFFSMGSGPGRALAQKEEIFKDIDYRDTSDTAVMVLEGAAPPPEPLTREIAETCGVKPENLTIVYAPTHSLAGTFQIVGRVVEVSLHKAHELKFDLSRILEGVGSAPLSPPHPDFITAMGRTNDATIFGGRVVLYVTGPDADAEELAAKLPSTNSNDFGTPFAEIFSKYEGDFYKIDPMLFSPAEVAVVAVESGKTFRGGGVDPKLLDMSFG